MSDDNVQFSQRLRWVIVRMRGLSEVSAPTFSGSKGVPKSTPPPGTVLGHRKDLRDLSLADYWQMKFNSAPLFSRRLEVFLFLAERDLARALRRQPQADPDETREQRERRVIEQYEGLSPLEAALAEDCSEAWIRKVRKAAGVDTQTGTLS